MHRGSDVEDRHPSPISPGALILIKALGTDRIYDVSTLRSHALRRHTSRAIRSGTKRLMRSRKFGSLSFPTMKVSCSQDWAATSGCFGDDRPGDDSSAPSRRRTGWVEDLAAHYTKQGYRIRKDQYVGDTSIRFDMYLERGQRSWRLLPAT